MQKGRRTIVWHRHRGPQRARFRAVGWRYSCLCLSIPLEDASAGRNADATGLRFAIVVARFNQAITDKLLHGAEEALKKAGAADVRVFHVPGAFELPLAALRLAPRFDGIIALGAVIRGETPH